MSALWKNSKIFLFKSVVHAVKVKEYAEYIGHFLLEFFIIKKFQKKMTNVFSVLLVLINLHSFKMTQNQNLLCSFHYISYMIMHIILSWKYNGIGWRKKQIWHCLGRPHISQIQNFGTKIRQNCLCAFEKAISDLFQYIKIWFPVRISSSDIPWCHQWITFSEIKERNSV